MTGRGAHDDGLEVYLVERYWPDVTAARLEGAVERVARAAEELSRSGRPVHHLQSVLAVPEETVFSLFEACSADDVDAANRQSGVPFERVVEALVVPAGGSRPTGLPNGSPPTGSFSKESVKEES